MKFSLKIPCKPYVKRFLELNFGAPVDFTKDKSLYPDFRRKLNKDTQSSRYDKRYEQCAFTRYKEVVEVKITRDDFYRYGWELTITDMVDFNRQIEARAKLFMYVIVSTRMAFGVSQVDSIAYFQNQFGFGEDIWPAESINKDCQRNLTVQKNEILENISQLIDKISLAKLSACGTISQQLKKMYETN
jgi:hypothetical protein